MNFLQLCTGMGLSLLIVGCGGAIEEKKEKPPVKVDVLIAEISISENFIEVNGNVLAEESVDLYPEVSGRVVQLNMPDGATVQEGTVLAKLNDAELQAQLKQQQSQLNLALKTENRLKILLEANGVNQSEYDNAINQVNTLTAAVEMTKALIDKTVIKAPFSGKLGLRLISKGAFVNTQTKLGTLLQSDKSKIDFNIPANLGLNPHPGDTVYVQLNDKSERIKALISAVEPQISTSTRNIKLRARLINADIAAGSFVKVYLKNIQKGIVVPTNAIIPEANSNQLIVIKNGKGVFTNVETGLRTATNILIHSGINPGDTIVINGVLFVRPKADLQIRKVLKSEDIFNTSSKK